MEMKNSMTFYGDVIRNISEKMSVYLLDDPSL
jgi:hypothetical protein